MYTAVSLRLVRNGINQRWIDAQLSYATVDHLFSDCRAVYIAARILPDQTIRYLNLAQFAPTYTQYTGTVQQMLTAWGNAAAVEGPAPILESRHAVFSDATRAGYTKKPVHPTLGTTAAIEQRTDLLLTRAHPSTSYSHFATHAMVSVNGFYHMLETDGTTGIYVKNAGRSLQKSKQNQVGILSFASVSTLTHVPITTAMVKKRLTAEMIAGTVPEGPLSSTCYVKLGRSLVGKSVLMVIGGYLFLPDSDIVTRVSDDEFAVDFTRVPMLNRYYESRAYLDLSSLGLSTTANNIDQISVPELYSDAVLTKYLTLSQSFFVVLDTPELYVQSYYVKKTGTPGMYISYQEPMYPLMVGGGRMPEYWPTKEEDRWSLSSHDAYARTKLYDTTDPLRLTSVSGLGLPLEPDYYADARLIEIGRDIR
jgi:hypothetical protein